MTITNLTHLIGLKSSDPKIASWFEIYNLGKPPKTINANQDSKGATDKENLVAYTFKFDIINDAFYPPISPKNDDYNFESYLTHVTVFSKPKKKDFIDPKPFNFWDGFVNPTSSFEDCCGFFNNQFHESKYEDKIINVSFEKKLNDIVTATVFLLQIELRSPLSNYTLKNKVKCLVNMIL